MVEVIKYYMKYSLYSPFCFCQVVIFVVSLILFTLEVVGIVADGTKYLKVENLIDHFTLITSIILVTQVMLIFSYNPCYNGSKSNGYG